MELSSALEDLSVAVDALVRKTEIFSIAGSDVASVVSSLEVIERRVQMFKLEVAEHGISCNQHNEDQAPDARSWLASLLDVSLESAGSQLFSLSKLNKHAFIAEEVRNGTLSFEKGAMIARIADGKTSVEEEMMPFAHSSSYEELRKRGIDFKTVNEEPQQREKRLRNEQYVRSYIDENGMIVLRGRFLPSVAAKWMPKLDAAEKYARRTLNSDENELSMGALTAEAFSDQISEYSGSESGSSSKPQATVVVHVNVEDDGSFPEHGEVAGLGIVPITFLDRLDDKPIVKLLIEAGSNKLLWYSSHRYKPQGPFLQWMKEMILERGFNICQTPGCTKLATECDHKLARNNGGRSDPANGQGLCDSDHDAKTRKDAPWTAGGIFGNKNSA